MNRIQRIFTTLVASTALLLGCGGGGGGSSTTPPISGITGVGLASGPITGFGSIFVNGVEFSTSNATIRVDGSSGTESQLKVGQIVTVQGRINDDGRTGTANTVTYDDSLDGPISSIDLAGSSFVVLGQTVRVTGTTSFDSGSTLATLAVGNVVEVSGAPNAAGEIVASRVERKAAAGELEITGVVANLDSNLRRFSIGALTVDYTSAALSNGTPANGNCVEAKGNTVTNNVLTATRVEVKPCNVAVNQGDLGEIEGIITRFTSSSDFEIAGRRVVTNAQTTYENGTAADLRLNLKIEAEGTFDGNGTLTARKIQIKRDTSARMLGTVDAVSTANNTLTIFGITATTSATGTRFEDKSNANLRPFRLSDVRTGDYLEVRGFEGSTTRTVTAVIVERDDLDNRRELQGIATNVAQPNLTLIGVTVTTTGTTVYRDTADAPITATAFYAAAPNRVVKARGTWNGTALTATEIELEN